MILHLAFYSIISKELNFQAFYFANSHENFFPQIKLVKDLYVSRILAKCNVIGHKNCTLNANKKASLKPLIKIHVYKKALKSEKARIKCEQTRCQESQVIDRAPDKMR